MDFNCYSYVSKFFEYCVNKFILLTLYTGTTFFINPHFISHGDIPSNSWLYSPKFEPIITANFSRKPKNPH